MENEKKVHALKIKVLVLKYSKTLLELKKEFYLLFWENIIFFLDRCTNIFQKYHCTQRCVHILVAVVRIGRWVGGLD